MDKIFRRLHLLEKQLEDFISRVERGPIYHPLTTPLTSTSWDGDAYSTTAKTEINLNTVFGVPAGAKAVQVWVAAQDSGSEAGTNIAVLLSPNATAAQGPVWCRLDGTPNDHYHSESGKVPCNASGNIYYQVAASGVGTMDIWIQIWGWWI